MQFSSVASAVQLAETALSEWNVFRAWYCAASECDPNCSRACFVHRESGRALKLLCQLSAWVHHIQQRRSSCRVCRESWNACRCSVRLDPRAWTTACDITQARDSQRNLLPVFKRRDIWPSIVRIEEIKGQLFRDFVRTSRTSRSMFTCFLPNCCFEMWAAASQVIRYVIYVGCTLV